MFRRTIIKTKAIPYDSYCSNAVTSIISNGILITWHKTLVTCINSNTLPHAEVY